MGRSEVVWNAGGVIIRAYGLADGTVPKYWYSYPLCRWNAPVFSKSYRTILHELNAGLQVNCRAPGESGALPKNGRCSTFIWLMLCLVPFSIRALVRTKQASYVT
uniref:Uncharacterized protein n=1 Tax=Arundo donax TaxID=35708 RepID=A0A0A9B5M9_ARUDO